MLYNKKYQGDINYFFLTLNIHPVKVTPYVRGCPIQLYLNLTRETNC